MVHRYSGNLMFDWGNTIGEFYVEQCEPKPAKAGIGPYCVIYKSKGVRREKFHGECKYWLENLVNDHREVARQIRKLQTEFVEKWQLPDFPESL